MTGEQAVECWEILRFQWGRGKLITQAQMPRNGEAVENGGSSGSDPSSCKLLPSTSFSFLRPVYFLISQGKNRFFICLFVFCFLINRILRDVETTHWVISEHPRNFHLSLVLSINFWSGRKKEKRRYLSRDMRIAIIFLLKSLRFYMFFPQWLCWGWGWN